MRRSSEVGRKRGFIPLISVVAVLATLIPNPALAGEGSRTEPYIATDCLVSCWPCGMSQVATDNVFAGAPTEYGVQGACFPLDGSEQVPASIEIRDELGIPGYFIYRFLEWDDGWYHRGGGGRCGTFASISTIPTSLTGNTVYLQIQLLHGLFNSCPDGTYSTGTITFSFTTGS